MVEAEQWRQCDDAAVEVERAKKGLDEAFEATRAKPGLSAAVVPEQAATPRAGLDLSALCKGEVPELHDDDAFDMRDLDVEASGRESYEQLKVQLQEQVRSAAQTPFGPGAQSP